MVGTGSEMNGGSVITNHATKLKIGKVFGENVMPKFAILNPRYTFSVPQRQMVAGFYDIMCHILEQYLSGMMTTLQTIWLRVDAFAYPQQPHSGEESA